MYAPLKFIEQVGRYFIPYGNEFDITKANSEIQGYIEEYMSEGTNLDDFWSDYARYSDRIRKIGKYPKVIGSKYIHFEDKVKEATGCFVDETPYDTFNYLFMSSICNYWKYRKFAYKIEGTLAHMLINMEADPEVALECFKHQPTKVFYIDLSELQGYLCKGMEGMFATSSLYDNQLVLLFTVLIRGENNRLIPIFSRFIGDFNKGAEEDKDSSFIFRYASSVEEVNMYLEDGTTRPYREKDTIWLFLNFLLYLQASNKDVEEGEVSRKHSAKKNTSTGKPKNTFKEVKQYEVGYRLVSERKSRENSNNSSSRKGTGLGTKKSPHFRRAHWHHRWVGSGENRHLELRWQEGSFVNGMSEIEKVSLHVVKK